MYNMFCKLLFNLCVLFFVRITVVVTQSDKNEHGHSIKEISQPFKNATGYAKIETVSFTERYLERRIGRKINLKKLLSQYSSVCPLQRSCGVDYDGLLSVENMYNLNAFSGCEECTCDRRCVEQGDCCPGTHYGYFKHECVETILYPQDKTSTSYMVDNCLDRYSSNNTVIELCKNQMRPCSGLESKITFKNMFCAQCNDEHDCVQWSLNVDCLYSYIPEDTFKSFSQIKSIIDEYGCIIKYQYPKWTSLGGSCDKWDYQKQVSIDKCNVTGLWQIYDADLEWACANFITPYNNFKNVFCYICNPSQAYSQTVPQIDKCSIFENGSNSFDSLIIEACEAFPASERFWPFKNRYCYACSEGQNLLENSNTDAFSVSDVSEINDQLTLQTELSFSLVFDTPKEFERLVQENLKETFQFVDVYIESNTSKSFYNSSSIENIINNYVTVCGAKNLCMDKVTSGKTYGNPVCGECTCTSTCAEMETCCPDIIVSKQPYSCLDSMSVPSLCKLADSSSEWHGVQISGEKSYKIKDECLEKDHPFAHSCSSYDNNTDLLSNIPVGTAANVMYRNIYCYSCNNNKSDIILNIQAMCDTYIEHGLFTEVAELIRVVKLHCQRISFVPLNSRQCKTYDPETASYVGGIEHNRIEMHPSAFDFEIIEKTSVLARNLNDSVKTVYSSCNQTGYLEEHNILMTEVCKTEAVNLLSLPEYNIGNTVYKNFACFLCNPMFMSSNINLSSVILDCQLDNSTEWFILDENLDYLCRTTEKHRRWYPYKNMYCAECNLPPWQRVIVIIYPYDVLSPSVYTYLFSLTPEDFERIERIPDEDVIPQCPGGTFDFSQNQCRLLHCNEGYELFNTSCRPVLQILSPQSYSVSLQLIYSENTDVDGYESDLNINISMIDLVELCEKIIEMMASLFDNTTVFNVQGFLCRVPAPCKTKDNSSFSESVTFYNSTPSSIDHLGLFFDILNINYIDIAAGIRINHTQTINKDIIALLNLMSKSYHLQNLTDIEGRLQSVSLNSVLKDDWDRQVFKNSCSFVQGELLFKETFTNVDRFLLCPYVKLNLSEAILLDNQSLVLNAAEATFKKNEYKVMDGHFIICDDDYNRQTKKTTFADEPVVSSDGIENILNIFNMTCTVISLICLFLTFILHCVFSSLRTIPGKNLMLLCLSLFCAQGFLQFGLRATRNSAVCICIGIGIHYFWMAAFCAMHICSFHMFKVFYFSDLSNGLFRNQRHLFIKYLLYCMFFPLALVLVTVFSNSMSVGNVNAGYGENVCFISDFYIFVGTFLVPATLIFLNNIVFFILAFHRIRISPNVPSNQEKKNFFIFLRLCTIVGVTWPLLILSNVVNTIWISFVVSGINSLQGVYIFVSFILNKRVLSMCVALLRKERTDSALTNTSSTSERYKYTYTSRL